MRTTIRLPDDLLRRAKRRASEQGRTLTSLVEEGLKLALADAKPARRGAVHLPVSKATGGTARGRPQPLRRVAGSHGRALILPDVNVLLHAFRSDSSDHERCRAWLSGVVNGDSRYGISTQVLSGCLVRGIGNRIGLRVDTLDRDYSRFPA